MVTAALVGACGADGAASGDGRVDVVAAFYPLAEATRRVGGDAVSVRDLTPAGVEPHDLELTPEQVDSLEDADLILYLGGGFQPAVEEIAERRGDAAVDLLARGTEDPHFWLDPVGYRGAVERIAETLARVRPAQRRAFERGAAAFDARLTQLDEEIRSALARCERRTLLTSHEAFGHFARRYDLVEESIAGLSPEAEPDADRLAELADLVEQTGTTTVFTEALVSPDVARALAREAGVETAVLDPLESRPGGGGNYLSVMRENVAALVDALGCTPP